MPEPYVDDSPIKQTNSLSDPAIPASYIRMMAQELGLSLKELPQLFQFTNLNVEVLQQEDKRISTQDFLTIFNQALHLNHHEDFGLKLGARLKPTTHGPMGFLLHSSPNLMTALEAIQHFLPTRMNFAHVELQKTHEFIHCSIHFTIELSQEMRRVLLEACMVVFCECAEFMIGQRLNPAKINFNFAEPCYSALYADYFHAEYSFDHEIAGIRIPLQLCEIPNSAANPEIYLIAKQQCEYLLNRIQLPETSVQSKVQKLLISNLHHFISEEQVAQSLFVSKRTLARYLEHEGTDFRQIRESVLSHQSLYYLKHTELSIEVIANLLNYYDASNFRRAFKRWFGLTPSQYRTQHSKP